MKTILNTIFLFIFTISLQAQITVKSMTGHYDASVQSIRPYLQLQNEGTEVIDLNNFYVEYYIFDENIGAEDLVASIYTASPSVSHYSIDFTALDKVYEIDGKKANMKLCFSFASGSTIAAGSFVKLHQGINKVGWNYIFEEADDWSYASNTNYTYNENIVVRNIETDEVVFGNDPTAGGSTVIPSTTLQWLGTKTFAQLSSIKIREGDTFFNSDDKNSYVYFSGRWAQLAQCGILADGSVSFHKPVAGVYPQNKEHLATKEYVDNNTYDTTKLQINADGSISAPQCDAGNIAFPDDLITLEYLQKYIDKKLEGYVAKTITTSPSSLKINGFTGSYINWNGIYELKPSGYYQLGDQNKYISNTAGMAVWVFGPTINTPYYDGICYTVDNWPGSTSTGFKTMKPDVSVDAITVEVISQ